MSAPLPPHSNGIKRSASDQFEEPPNKRADISGNLTPDHGYGRDQFSYERQLVPMISRAETAQFVDYTKDMIYSNGPGNDDDESEDEFVDAQEDVALGEHEESIPLTGDVPDTLFNGDFMAIKKEAGDSPMEETEQIDDAPNEETEKIDEAQKEEPPENKDTKQEKPENDQFLYHGLPNSQKQEAGVQEIKPETIWIASDAGYEYEQKADVDKQEPEEKHETISVLDDDDKTEQTEDFVDIFAATFGKDKIKESAEIKETIEDEGEEDANSAFSGGPGKGFVSGVHKTTIRNGSSGRHTSTPPSSTPPPVTAASHPAPPPRRRPDIKRDLSGNLVRHEKFHTRVQLLIPRLPNHENFEWTRRYWIAVMIEGKRLKNTTTEKDFVWMKGNRFSTVATVFHSYALAVMADPEDLALMLGQESVEMTDQMQELDYFNDRLVVFRAIKVQGNETQAEGRSLVPGIVPASEVISLDLD